MRVLDAAFREPVKFPKGKNGEGKVTPRKLIDHPVSPDTEHTMHWAPVNGSFELVVTHVKSGVSVGVPRENVAWSRPPLSELLAASKVDAGAKK